jgi:hypothetical protein
LTAFWPYLRHLYPSSITSVSVLVLMAYRGSRTRLAPPFFRTGRFLQKIRALHSPNQKLDPQTSLHVPIKPKRSQYSSHILSCRHFLELSNVLFTNSHTHTHTHTHNSHNVVQNCFEWIVHAMHHILLKCSLTVVLRSFLFNTIG